MKFWIISLEVLSFLIQLALCICIILLALPFIVIKVSVELFMDSLKETSFIKRVIMKKN